MEGGGLARAGDRGGVPRGDEAWPRQVLGWWRQLERASSIYVIATNDSERCRCGLIAQLKTISLPRCSYLSARGLLPLGAVEWEAYKQQALAEFSVAREAHDEELREAGHSGFFNSRVSRVPSLPLNVFQLSRII